jgi:hypothetical protein
MNTHFQPVTIDASILQLPHEAGRHLVCQVSGRLASLAGPGDYLRGFNKPRTPQAFDPYAPVGTGAIARVSQELDHPLEAIRFNLRKSLYKSQRRKLGPLTVAGSMGTMVTKMSGEREVSEMRAERGPRFGEAAPTFAFGPMMQMAASTGDVQSLQAMLQHLMNFLGGQAGNEAFSKPPRQSPNPAPGSLQEFGQLVYERCTDQLLIKRNHKQETGPTFSNPENEVTSPPVLLRGSDCGPMELLNLSKASREDSIRVQEYLKSLDPVNLDLVATFLSMHLEELITDKFGNYVVQLLVNIHPDSLRSVIDLGVAKFKDIAVNEYGSRLFQVVCALSSEFNTKALKLFEANFDDLITNIAGSILLSRLIATADSELNYRFAIRKLEKNKSYLQKGYYNRMLATLVGTCSDTMASEVVNLIKNNVWVLMNDKFGNYVLQVLFTRDNQQAISLCKVACLRNANNILFRKYPKYILLKIHELGTYSSFIEELVTAILKSSDIIYQDLASKSEAFNLFLLLLCSLQPDAVLEILDPLESALFKCQKSIKFAKSQEFLNIIRQFRQAARSERGEADIPLE